MLRFLGISFKSIFTLKEGRLREKILFIYFHKELEMYHLTNTEPFLTDQVFGCGKISK